MRYAVLILLLACAPAEPDVVPADADTATVALPELTRPDSFLITGPADPLLPGDSAEACMWAWYDGVRSPATSAAVRIPASAGVVLGGEGPGGPHCRWIIMPPAPPDPRRRVM